MALATGDKVNFVAVSGSNLPANPDDATLYFIKGSNKLYLGSTLIATAAGETYTAGDHVDISAQNVISSDQADAMDYDDYDELTTAEKMDGTIRFLDNCPDSSNVWYDSDTGYLDFAQGYATYNTDTGYIMI